MDALLISALGEALIIVLKKLGENVTDPLLKRSAEPLQQLLTRGYDQKKDEARLRTAVEAASREFKAATWKQYRFDQALRIGMSNPKLAKQIIALALGMTAEMPERVPLDLLAELKLDKERRPAFARFLFHLRKQLAYQDDFRAGIEYADRLAQRGFLDNTLVAARRQIEIEDALLVDRRLTLAEEKALRDYLDHVRDQSRFMPLPVTKQHILGQRLDVDSNEVFVPLTLRNPEDEQIGRGEPDPDYDAAGAATFAEIFNRYSCFLLKGPPGCGKTTLLHRAALAFASGTAESDLGWSGPLLLPIFLRLRNFGVFLAENRSRFIAPAPGALTAFMENHFREEYRISLSAGFFDDRLKEGRCLILLDGLDEVAADRPQVAQFVSAFIQAYEKHQNRFMLASRPKGYESVEMYLRRAEPAIVEVNPLDARGIRKLVANLFAALEANPIQRAKDVVHLPHAILASPKLKAMAGTPLFCAALVLVYKYRGAQLPQQRAEVYSQIIDLLLGLWKATDQGLAEATRWAKEDGTGANYPDVSTAVNTKKRRLSHLALWMQDKGLSEVPAQTAKDVLKDYLKSTEGRKNDLAREWADNFLNNAHESSGLFVEMEAERYAFTHQGFREFLAATALKNKRENDFISSVQKHATEDWWEEVILLAGAHPELPDALRGYLIEVLLRSAEDTKLLPDQRHACLLMAGQCAADMASLLPDPQRNQAIDKLRAAMTRTDLEPKKRLKAGEVLDALGWMPPDLDDFVYVEGAEGFWISKYPVTNRQYLRFLGSLDYADPELWKSVRGYDAAGQTLEEAGEQAWNWFTQNGGNEVRPRFWDDRYFGASRRLFPVVGVSWYEAAAYCAWLNRHWEELKLPFSREILVRLPLEKEWDAALGRETVGPWQQGNRELAEQVVLTIANTCEAELNRTTPVCMYPDGKNAGGIMDLMGNVWEWQSNQYDLGKPEFALRGGAWTNSCEITRISDVPTDSATSCGFRVLICRENPEGTRPGSDR